MPGLTGIASPTDLPELDMDDETAAFFGVARGAAPGAAPQGFSMAPPPPAPAPAPAPARAPMQAPQRAATTAPQRSKKDEDDELIGMSADQLAKKRGIPLQAAQKLKATAVAQRALEHRVKENKATKARMLFDSEHNKAELPGAAKPKGFTGPAGSLAINPVADYQQGLQTLNDNLVAAQNRRRDVEREMERNGLATHPELDAARAQERRAADALEGAMRVADRAGRPGNLPVPPSGGRMGLDAVELPGPAPLPVARDMDAPVGPPAAPDEGFAPPMAGSAPPAPLWAGAPPFVAMRPTARGYGNPEQEAWRDQTLAKLASPPAAVVSTVPEDTMGGRTPPPRAGAGLASLPSIPVPPVAGEEDVQRPAGTAVELAQTARDARLAGMTGTFDGVTRGFDPRRGGFGMASGTPEAMAGIEERNRRLAQTPAQFRAEEVAKAAPSKAVADQELQDEYAVIHAQALEARAGGMPAAKAAAAEQTAKYTAKRDYNKRKADAAEQDRKLAWAEKNATRVDTRVRELKGDVLAAQDRVKLLEEDRKDSRLARIALAKKESELAAATADRDKWQGIATAAQARAETMIKPRTAELEQRKTEFIAKQTTDEERRLARTATDKARFVGDMVSNGLRAFVPADVSKARAERIWEETHKVAAPTTPKAAPTVPAPTPAGAPSQKVKAMGDAVKRGASQAEMDALAADMTPEELDAFEALANEEDLE